MEGSGDNPVGSREIELTTSVEDDGQPDDPINDDSQDTQENSQKIFQDRIERVRVDGPKVEVGKNREFTELPRDQKVTPGKEK